MISVVIIDDHTMFRQGLMSLFSGQDGIVISGETGNSLEAVKLLLDKEPDIALVDLSMPVRNGIEIVREAKGLSLKTAFIVLSMSGDPLTVSRALDEGASGYLLKDNTFDEILVAVRTVAEGERYICPALMDNLMAFNSSKAGRSSDLSQREKEVLSLIAAGLTNKEIADRRFISVKTVETHRARIMSKLGLHRTADLVRYAVEKNLIGQVYKP